MKTDKEAIKELEEIARTQRNKRTNLIQWLIIAVLGLVLSIVSLLNPPKDISFFEENKNIKETIMAIPLPTSNPIATKVKPQ
jgi:hypothetical protein